MKTDPPFYARKLLRTFCSRYLIEEIEGDLIEAYRFRLQHHSKFQCDLWFLLDVLRFFRPYTLGRSLTKHRIQVPHYLKVSFRHFRKKPFLALPTVFGLATGISAVVLVISYLGYELQFDSQFGGDTYRLIYQNADQKYACMPFPDYSESDEAVQKTLVNRLNGYTGVKSVGHFVPHLSPISLLTSSKVYVQTDSKKLVFDDLIFTNTRATIEQLIPLNFVQGSSQEITAHYNTVALTESATQKLFGNNWRSLELIGRRLEIHDNHFEIGGIVEDSPENVHFSFDIIVYQQQIPSWAAYTYVQIDSQTDIKSIEQRLNKELDLVYPDQISDGGKLKIGLMPVSKIHFTKDLLFEIKSTADLAYLKILGLIGLIILIVSWVNFVSSSITSHAHRQKQLGVRQVLGANKKDINLQILVDSFVLSFSSLPLSIAFFLLFAPIHNKLLEMPASLAYHSIMRTTAWMTLLLVLTALLGSLYPSIYFRRKELRQLLRRISSIAKSWSLQRLLLGSQFFFLILLASLATMISFQMKYLQNKPKGFATDGVIYFRVDGAEKFKLMQEEMEKIPEISGLGSGMIPGQNMYAQLSYRLAGTDQTFANATHIVTSKGSMQLYGFKSASIDRLGTGERLLVINQHAADKLATVLGITPASLIGQTIILEPEQQHDKGWGYHHTIADIIPNFDYFTLKHRNQPLFIEVHDQQEVWIYNMILKVRTSNWFNTIEDIEQAYLKVEETQPFDVRFLDDSLQDLYKKDRNLGKLANSLTIVCLILSIIGLSGVVGFVALSRQKEIGIRKVFGATLLSILHLISRDYLFMVVGGGILAAPFFYYLSVEWLNSFAYHVSVDFSILIICCFLTLAMVLTIVVIQSYKSTVRNPAETLKYE